MDVIPQNYRILVVDDNVSIHDDFRKILNRSSSSRALDDAAAALFGEAATSATPSIEFEIDSAYQGREGYEMVAAAKLHGQPYAAAFVDMRMPPGWDGVETIRHMWEADPDLEAVICTAYSDYSWNEVLVQLKLHDQLLILKKPFDYLEACQLANALTRKWNLARAAQWKLSELEGVVSKRTEHLEREIEERKQVEVQLREKDEQLQQKQRLEALGSLAGGVAHEFNNLLQAIQGYTTFAMEGLAEDDQRFRDLLQSQTAAGRAATIASQLLNFSRQRPTQRAVHNLNTVVEKTMDLMQPLLKDRAEICLALDPASPNVLIDESAFEQAIMNLCINGRDAMPEGGQLKISTTSVELPEEWTDERGQTLRVTPGQYVLLQVSDSGTGIPKQIQNRIFDPFFTTKEIGKGTGLGMSLVYSTVQQHDGLLTLISEEDRGTTFRIYIPAAEVTQVEEVLVSFAENDFHGKETILVVEDEPIVRKVVKRMLEKWGYRTVLAASGEEAIALVQQVEIIDAVLLDCVMPGMSGNETYRHLMALRPSLPVILCTGYDPDTAAEALPEVKDLFVVEKPFERDDLLRTLRTVLDQLAGRAALDCSTARSGRATPFGCLET